MENIVHFCWSALQHPFLKLEGLMARHTLLAGQGDESASRRCIEDVDRAAESLMSEGAARGGVILLSSRRSLARRWSHSLALQGLIVIASFSLFLATRGAHGLTITSPPPRQWATPPAQLPSCKVSDLVDEIESVTSDNNERLAELHASSEMLVSKLEEVRIQLVGGGSPSAVSSEADEPDCPDWVDALGDGGSGADTWIDEGSPQSPYAEKAASQYEASYSDGVDMGDSHFRQDGRVTVVGKQEHRSPPGLLRTRSIDDLVLAGSTLESRSKPVDELVVFLDLDKCSIYGQDGNDMTIACQWMQGGMDVLCGVYRRMLNPQLRPLFKQLQMCVEKTPVVIYTMRPQLLRYKSAVRRRLVNLRWKNEWHHNDDQVIVPPEVTEASQVIKEYSGIVPLHEQEEQDLTMSFQRLLAIRQVIKDELELDYMPTIVVTSIMKDVQGTAKALGLPPEKSYLWDDNEVLKGQPHVLTVDPYVAMQKQEKDELLNFLESRIPCESLSPDVVDFMLGAKPDSCSMKVDDSGKRHYVVPEGGNINHFPIPDLPLRYTTPMFNAMNLFDDACSKAVNQGEGDKKELKHSKYHGDIVEFYTASWRRADETARNAKKKWEEQSAMVW